MSIKYLNFISALRVLMAGGRQWNLIDILPGKISIFDYFVVTTSETFIWRLISRILIGSFGKLTAFILSWSGGMRHS